MSRLSNDAGIKFFAGTIDQPLDGAELPVFLKRRMADRGTDLLRLKGIVATEEDPAPIDISDTSSNPSSGSKPGPPPSAAAASFSPPPTRPRIGSEPC